MCVCTGFCSLQTFVHETKKTNKYTGRIHTHTHTQKHSIKHFNLYKGNNKVCNQLIGLCFSRKKKSITHVKLLKNIVFPKLQNLQWKQRENVFYQKNILFFLERSRRYYFGFIFKMRKLYIFVLLLFTCLCMIYSDPWPQIPLRRRVTNGPFYL